MTDPEQRLADYTALNELIVNCPDLDRLESLLGGFNLFQVLKFEHGEIRHSNVLAWILDTAESHGLDDTFLRKWLMRVIHEGAVETDPAISAIDIDTCQLVEVEVRREWQCIDVLVILTLAGGQQWVVSVENKINSAQHSNQLQRYRHTVEASFPGAAKRLFIFLTKSGESPHDPAWLPASFTQIHQTLKECLQSRLHVIGSEPKVLIENYLRLLEEKFMDDSEIARTARRIYNQHRRALDIIFEHRPDNLKLASAQIRELFSANAERLGITMEACTKSYVRLIPKAWDQPGNTRGGAWAELNRTVIFEMSLLGQKVSFYAIAAKGPEAWMDNVWRLSEGPPFKRARPTARPRIWCSLHRSSMRISLDEDDQINPSDVAQRIFDWACDFYRSDSTRQVIEMIAKELPALESAFSPPSSPTQ